MVIDNKVLHHFKIKMIPKKVYTLYKFTGVIHSVENAELILKQSIQEAFELGYQKCYRLNKQFWDEKWEISNVDVSGDKDVDLAIKNAIYHLISVRPYSEYVSIPANGLSGQAEKGAVLWDTEISMLPFYLNTDLESARRIIKYRIHGLKGALGKALQYGYKGAFYALESQESGFDASRDYDVTDSNTNEPVRSYLKEKQIHVNAAIVYGIHSYLQRTDDYSVLLEGGLEMVFECGVFYANRANYHEQLNRYEFKDVIGPNEYLEGVNNHAYTNYMVKMTLDSVLECLRLARKANHAYVKKMMLGSGREEGLELIRKVRNDLYLPRPNKHDIIEQFDGYFQLEDRILDQVKKRGKHSNESLIDEQKKATSTKIIKQADVATLLVLLGDEFRDKVKKANFHYYVSKAELSSSLSATMYSLLAAEIDEVESAFPIFMKTAMMDVLGEGKQTADGIYIGSTHPSSSGGSYLSMIYGFAGLKHLGYILSADYRLPKGINAITFKVIVKNHIAKVKVQNTKVSITWGDTEDDIEPEV